MKRVILTLIMILLATPIIAFALTNSTIYCIDNETLAENITIYKDNNVSTLMLPVKCDWGCDNTTNTCNPPIYQQNLIILGIIIIVIVGLYYLKKRLK